MSKKSSAKSWLTLGFVFIVILFIVGYLINSGILEVSYGAYTLISAIFGFGGALFLFIGIIKFIVGKFKKNNE